MEPEKVEIPKYVLTELVGNLQRAYGFLRSTEEIDEVYTIGTRVGRAAELTQINIKQLLPYLGMDKTLPEILDNATDSID
jgi:hypothetical protein